MRRYVRNSSSLLTGWLERALVAGMARAVDPARFARVLRLSEPWPEMLHPEAWVWVLYPRIVPIGLLHPPSVSDYEEDGDEEGVHRCDTILALYRAGKRVWPIIVDENGTILDGYHRLAVLNDLGQLYVSVLQARRAR